MPQSDFDRSWRAFVDADRDVQAPVRLRRTVMAAWNTPDAATHQAPPRLRGVLAVGAVAAVLAAVGAAIGLSQRARPLAHRAERSEHRPSAPAAPVIRLVADAALENEPLQVIRVRLPRASLADLGMAPGESDVSSLVDVDVVVGSDGLPRAIRHVGPAFDVDHQ